MTNYTNDGVPCQRWDSTTPHADAATYLEDYKTFLENAHNFCRNPDGDDAPWCFTMDPNVEWAFCNIPRCSTFHVAIAVHS